MRAMRDEFHPTSLQWNPIQLYDCMAEENEIAYCPMAFCYTNYSRTGFRKNLLYFHDAPGINNAVLGGAGIAVTASCRHPEAAAGFAAWLCSNEIQASVYVRAQGQPGNKFAWLNEEANNRTNHFFTNTLATLSNAYVRPRYKDWPAFQQWLGETLHSFLVNDTPAERVLQQLQERYSASCELGTG